MIIACVLWPCFAAAQDSDRGFIAGLLEDALGGPGRIIRIEGFSGALSATARIERVTIADDNGTWLSIDAVEMSWNRGALLRGAIEVERLTADTIVLERLPLAQPSEAPTAEAQGFELPDLPVSVQIDLVEASRIELGAPLLGEAAALTLSTSLSLIDGEADIKLLAERLDGPEGQFDILADYSNETRDGSLRIALREAPEGLAARLLDLPGLPSVDLVIDGKGAFDDFAADLTLRTDDVERLAGDLSLQADAEQARIFDAQLRGDVTALFAPAYRDFFGPDLQVDVSGRRAADGALRLDRLLLEAEALQLEGTAALNADGWPQSLDINGRLGANGLPVTLPVSGPQMQVVGANFDLSFDAAAGDTWRGRFSADQFERDGIAVGQMTLNGAGQIQQDGDGSWSADLDYIAQDIGLPDLDLAAALGRRISGRIEADYAVDAPLRLDVLTLRGANFALDGSAQIDGLDQAFETSFDVALDTPDLSFASALAGRPLGGSLSAQVVGTADAGGAFDATLTGRGLALRFDLGPIDTLLRGTTALTVAARRDDTGLALRRFELQNDQALISANGQLSSAQGGLEYSLRLSDLGIVVAELPGPLDLDGRLDMEDDVWRVTATGAGPLRSRLGVTGEVSPNVSVDYTLDLPNVAPLAPGFSGPLGLRGALSESNGAVTTRTTLDGPAGTRATVSGQIAPRPNLALTGSAPLGLANPFIAPRRIRGLLGFDLRATAFRPEGLSGNVTISNARLVLPTIGAAIEQIGGIVRLDRGQASPDVRATLDSGGAIGLNGTVGMGAPFQANLDLTGQGLVLEDPSLYRAFANAGLRVVGPLRGGARLSGRVDISEALINVAAASLGSVGAIPDIAHIGASADVQRSRARAGLTARQSGGGSAVAFPLDLLVSAPARIFVRGRGLDAELGGQLALSGTTSNVISSGGFSLIRGRFDILGQRFNLDRGQVSLLGDFDPFLDFMATTNTAEGTASVILSGRASEPDVRFEAVPAVPEDEVLAQILFGRNVGQLSALQALRLANALATLGGRNNAGVVSRLREGFGLDDFDIQTEEGGGASLRAGKYISENIYTDVTVDDSGRAGVSLNIDLSPSVTVRGATDGAGDTSIGLFFERDY